ncbi:MAG: PhoH family protein [Burkholderiaceae bacterium]|nr:PhoH family protein [Burkholderiaceae bacterium]
MKPKKLELVLEGADNRRLANLCGPLDENIRQIEGAFDIQIRRRSRTFSVTGDPARAEQAIAALTYFHGLSERRLGLEDVQLGLIDLRRDAAQASDPKEESPILQTRRSDLQGRTPRQRQYLRNILSHDITFSIGPAGTGKTYLAVACAVDALERDVVKRIVLTRPAVEAGERLGFLPGDLAQKIDPYLRPLYDALYDLMGFERTARMFERQSIEIAPLAYMRGRTLNHSFVILDEAQNTTPEQMKMFLTRIGFGSRAVVNGDITQVDLPKGQPSGLAQARRILDGLRGIAFTDFDSSDVVRHPLVARIVDAYERHAEPRPEGR